MTRSLKNWLTPPVFDDDAKTNQAHLLYIILWVLIFIPIPYVLYSLIQTPEEIQRVLIQTGVGEAANIFLMVMLRRGFVRFAAIAQVTLFFSFLAIAAASTTGVHGEAYLLGFPLVIAIAGVLLGDWGISILTVASLLVGLTLVIAESNGSFIPEHYSTALTTWFISLILFPIGALFQQLASRSVRKALARARASEERYRLISAVSSDYTFSTKLDANGDMQLNWVAGAFEAITGYVYEEYVAKGGWLAHLHPDDVQKDAQDLENLKLNRKVITEIRTSTKSGGIRWVRVYAHPVWDQMKNKLVGIVGAVQDITEQKQVEAEREVLIAQLEANNAELERFTYTVSHDLKSPLVTINGFLGYLERDYENGNYEEFPDSMERIKKAAGKMHELLNDLLELSRIGRLMNPPVEVPFGQIVQEALELLHGPIQANNVKVEVESALPIVCGDKLRLVEVVQNLIENAIKFMGNQPDPLIQIGVQGSSAEDMPIFYVRDNGQGIDPQFLDRIFGLFNKLDSKAEGTGIGLTIVKRIIEFHEGRIWVESEVGKGSTFYFTLSTK